MSVTDAAGTGSFSLLYTVNGATQTTGSLAYSAGTAPAAQTVQNAFEYPARLAPVLQPDGHQRHHHLAGTTPSQ